MTSKASRFVRATAVLWSAMLGVLPLGCAQRADTGVAEEAPAPSIPYNRELALESFDQVWTTVRDKHWDPTLGGVDWNAVRDELRPKVEAATTMEQARAAMGEMLDRLGQSHFGIWPQELYEKKSATAGTDAGAEAGQRGSSEAGAAGDEARAEAEEQAREEANEEEGVAGIDVRALGEDAIVTRVKPGSPADAAGVKQGWLVKEVGGRKVSSMVKRLGEAGSDETPVEVKLNMLFQRLFAGNVGERVEATFLDAEGREVKREITLGSIPGTPVTLGNLPMFYLEIDRERLAGNVEYFRFNVFMDPPLLMGEFQKSVESAQDAAGYIIDLRGNPGGIGGLAMGMGGWFVTEKRISLGTMITRSGQLNFVLNPRVRAFTGPVAILIDWLSGSTSEIFAGGMKDIGRVRIFGERSAGAALPSVFDVLPNGDRFQYAVANYISAGGKALEGNGVEPDEVVRPDRAALLAGRDPVIEAALAWIALQSPAADGAASGTN